MPKATVSDIFTKYFPISESEQIHEVSHNDPRQKPFPEILEHVTCSQDAFVKNIIGFLCNQEMSSL